jgi:uroporphyrinogen-III decarboxylase
LVQGGKDEIEAEVRGLCIALAHGGGYVLSSASGIAGDIRPENFVTMTRAVHKYGRYGSLGRQA